MGDTAMKWLLRRYLGVLASIAVVVGMKKRALELYREIAEIAPADARVGITLGAMLMEQGDSAQAIDALLRVIEHNPEYADGWFNLGFVYEQCDNRSEAERCFRRALELDPNQDRAWYGLALVLIRNGRLSEAVEALKRNIELQPFSPYGYYQLGMTYHHLGESSESWRVYEQLKTFEPKYAATLKRDLETTRVRAASAGRAASPSSDFSHKEALNPTT